MFIFLSYFKSNSFYFCFRKIEKEYESSDSDLEDSEDGHSEQSNMTATPRERRADFEAIMDEFLDKFEVIGGKMKPVMAGKTPVGKLETLRSELLGPGEQDSREERLAVKEQILKKLQAEQDAHHARPFSHIPKDRFTLLDDEKDHQNKWDCQTILSMLLACPLASFLFLDGIIPLIATLGCI